MTSSGREGSGRGGYGSKDGGLVYVKDGRFCRCKRRHGCEFGVEDGQRRTRVFGGWSEAKKVLGAWIAGPARLSGMVIGG